MRTLLRTNLVALLLALAAVSVLLAGAIYFINERSIQTLIVNSAKETAGEWAAKLRNRLTDIETIAQGGSPSPGSVSVIAQARAIGGVSRFGLFDAEGEKRLDSDTLLIEDSQAEKHDRLAPDVLATVRSGQYHVQFDEIETAQGGRLIAETYVPVTRGGRLVAILEVYVDQTVNAQRFRGAFAYNSMVIAALAALGFAVPALGFFRRTRQKQVADAHAAFLASHDLLTELLNRGASVSVLGRLLHADHEHGKLTALRVIDVDHFQEINAKFGAAAGDELLRAIADRLGDAVRIDDVAARLGSDEFVIAQPGFDSEAEIAAAGEVLVTTLAVPFRLPAGDAKVTFSIGTAVAPGDGRSALALIKNAETAVQVAKTRGRNGHCRFEPAFDAELQQRIVIETLVREAVFKDRFELHYQPLFDVKTAALKGFEALLRLSDHEGVAVPPDVFIPVAEAIGLIDEIGSRVLETACLRAATWPQPVKIAVNLSAAQFRRHSVCDATQRALALSGLEPARLHLEITESLLLADSEQVLEQLRELKFMGVAIVMDDFGSGYSSLGYMLKFPFDRLKIDRSFIAGLSANDDNARKVVEAIIMLGHTLKMTVTAEGVETLAQAHALREMNCDDAQGFLFGRPVPATDVAGIFLRQFVDRLDTEDAARRHVA